MFNYEIKPTDNLSTAVSKTIAFFDLFSYPLSVYEIYYYLDKKFPLVEIFKVLATNNQVSQKNGFYFLVKREEIMAIRQARHNYSVRKLKIAKQFSRFFSCLPFIKVVVLANSIGQHNLREESDIDFFIITSSRRIWLSRLYCTGLAKILNRRPNAKTKKDKLCLSFYLAEDQLDLTELKLPTGDPYFEYWQRSLVLLYNKERTYEKFLEINRLKQVTIPACPKINNYFVDFLEKSARRLQLAIMAPALKEKMNQNSGVVVNDRVLKLYLIDRRQEFLDKYEKKLQQLL